MDSTSAIWHYKQALWTSAFFCSAPLFTASPMICSPCIYWYCNISISVEQHSYLRYSKPKSPKDVCMLEGSRVDSTCRFALSIRHAPPDPILHFLIPSTAKQLSCTWTQQVRSGTSHQRFSLVSVSVCSKHSDLHCSSVSVILSCTFNAASHEKRGAAQKKKSY